MSRSGENKQYTVDSDIEALVNELSLEELCGQVLNMRIGRETTLEEVEAIAKRVHPGGFFVSGVTAEWIKQLTDIINKHSRIPVIVSADIEHGAGCCLKGAPLLPEPMS